MKQTFKQKFALWNDQVSDDEQLELYQQESDRKQQFNLSQQLSSKAVKIKDVKFAPELCQKNSSVLSQSR